MPLFLIVMGMTACDAKEIKTEKTPFISDFYVSSCNSSVEKSVALLKSAITEPDSITVKTTENNMLKISTTNTIFSCCMEELQKSITVTDNVIVINLTEDNSDCNCICGYGVDLTIGDIDFGNYTIKLLVSNLEYASLNVLFNENTNLTFKIKDL
jgi:hypothetical protein